MDEQQLLTFGDDPVVEAVTTQARFERFHTEHPIVYRRLVDLAYRVKRAGHDRWAIANLWEKLRWEIAVEGLPDSTEDFKLNDHYKSRYARLIMEREPELEGLFETRILTTP